MENKLTKTTLFALITVLCAFLALSTATFAWFTNNRDVYTNTITAKTGQADITLLLSQKNGNDFDGREECEILQVNEADAEFLLPVSTADLETFVVQNGEGDYSSLTILENEENYYHGRIYMKASQTGDRRDSKLVVYLDNTQTMFEKDEDSFVLNAARVGLVISDEKDNIVSSVILRPTEEENDEEQKTNNTYFEGELIDDGKVIGVNEKGSLIIADDPSKALSDFDISSTSAALSLAELNANTIYTLDVYYYIEGCDSDCSDFISAHGATMHIAFYGAMI